MGSKPFDLNRQKLRASHAQNVLEAQRRAEWEAANRQSNISPDEDVGLGEHYVQNAGFMQDARDIARRNAEAAGFPSYKQGGIVRKTGLAMVHKGERVVPKSGIHIKESHRGIFSRAAKRAGQGVQEHAHSVMRSKTASGEEKKRANFAIQAKKWHH